MSASSDNDDAVWLFDFVVVAAALTQHERRITAMYFSSSNYCHMSEVYQSI